MVCELSIKYLYNNSEMEDIEMKLEGLHHSIDIKEEYDQILDIDRIIVSERDVTISILEQYKDFPCLWDPSMKDYTNKNARNAALQILLEKLKILEKDATITTVKRKIENMRASYKREWKKVQVSKTTAAGAGDIYVPTLWYYEWLLFLNEKDALSRKAIDTTITCDEDEVSEIHRTERNISEKRPVKRRSTAGDLRKKQEKLIDCAQSLLSPTEESPAESYGQTVGHQISETHQTERNISEQRPVKRRSTAGDLRKTQEKPIDCAKSLLSRTEESAAESYGQTIGHQLKEMSNIQRCIAEKMISEVIFYGKLEKLSLQSSILLNNSACNYPSSPPSPYSPLSYHNCSPGRLPSPTYSSAPPVPNSISKLEHYTPNAPGHPSFSVQRLRHPLEPTNATSRFHTLQRNDVNNIGSNNAALKHPHHVPADTPSHTNSFQSNHDGYDHDNVLREYLIKKKD